MPGSTPRLADCTRPWANVLVTWLMVDSGFAEAVLWPFLGRRVPKAKRRFATTESRDHREATFFGLFSICREKEKIQKKIKKFCEFLESKERTEKRRRKPIRNGLGMSFDIQQVFHDEKGFHARNLWFSWFPASGIIIGLTTELSWLPNIISCCTKITQDKKKCCRRLHFQFGFCSIYSFNWTFYRDSAIPFSFDSSVGQQCRRIQDFTEQKE